MSKGRIIFVGVHNKPGMEPLDSRTKSGKIIDEVIAGLPGRECLKTNLYNTIEIPQTKMERLFHATEWRVKINPTYEDITVTLGLHVHFNFALTYPYQIIFANHPASRHIKKDEYIKELIVKILAL